MQYKYVHIIADLRCRKANRKKIMSSKRNGNKIMRWLCKGALSTSKQKFASGRWVFVYKSLIKSEDRGQCVQNAKCASRVSALTRFRSTARKNNFINTWRARWMPKPWLTIYKYSGHNRDLGLAVCRWVLLRNGAQLETLLGSVEAKKVSGYLHKSRRAAPKLNSAEHKTLFNTQWTFFARSARSLTRLSNECQNAFSLPWAHIHHPSTFFPTNFSV